MRRLAVKNSARPQAVAATNSGASEARAVSMRRSIRPVAWPMRLADPADREQQDRRGDRDENVVEAGDQPELLFVGNRDRALAFDMRAERVGRLRR